MENINFLYPICTKCPGILKINLNPHNYTISSECEKNHSSTNIFFQTFNQYYMNSKNDIEKKLCSNCKNKPDDIIFLCKTCSEKFCFECILEHSLTNQHHKIKQINNNPFKCKKHNWDISEYCLDCKQNLCLFCIIEAEVNHKKHKRISYSEIVPCQVEFAELRKNIKFRNEQVSDIINKINDWQKQIIAKTNKLIDKIKEESSFLNNFIEKFNCNFINYNHFKNYEYIKSYTKEIKNENLLKFSKSFNFEEKTNYILLTLKDLFINDEEKYYRDVVSNFQAKEKRCRSPLTVSTFLKVEQNLFLYQSDGKLVLSENKEDKFISHCIINFNENIYSMHYGQKLNKIFLCHTLVKKINILDFDKNNKTITLSDKEVIGSNNDNTFLKAIFLSNDYLVTSDSCSIIFWYTDTKFGNFHKRKEISLFNPITNLMQINENTIISIIPSQSILIFYNIDTFEKSKEINNIQCDTTPDSLIIIKNNYIIVNCINKLALISSNSLELIQIYELETYPLYHNNFIFTNYIDDTFILVNNYSISDKEYKQKSSNLCLFCLNKNNSNIQLLYTKKISLSNNYNHLMYINEEKVHVWNNIKLIVYK